MQDTGWCSIAGELNMISSQTSNQAVIIRLEYDSKSKKTSHQVVSFRLGSHEPRRRQRKPGEPHGGYNCSLAV